MRTPRRRTALLTGALLAAGLAVASTSSLVAQREPSPLDLPAAGEVAEVRASLRKSEFLGQEAVPEFVVPPDAAPDVLRALRPGEYARGQATPDGRDQLGAVTVTARDGRVLQLRAYLVEGSSTLLSPDGETFYWGGPGLVEAIQSAAPR